MLVVVAVKVPDVCVVGFCDIYGFVEEAAVFALSQTVRYLTRCDVAGGEGVESLNWDVGLLQQLRADMSRAAEDGVLDCDGPGGNGVGIREL